MSNEYAPISARGFVLAVVLAAAVAGCTTDRPSYQAVSADRLPPELVRSVKSAYPDAVIDKGWEITAQVGTGYEARFQTATGRYTMSLMRYK